MPAMSGLAVVWKFLLGVAAPILALILAWMTIKNNSMFWFRAAFVFVFVWVLIQGIDAFQAWKEEKAIHRDTNTVIDYLIGEIQRAAAVEQTIRGDAQAEQHFERYRDEVEGWRARVGDELEVRLPRSGASQVFLAALGTTGNGRLYWEYTQLRSCQAALTSILGASDAFVRRSRNLAN
jgi:hypothetical protein